LSSFEQSLAVAGVPAAAPWLGSAVLHTRARRAARRRPAVDARVPRLRVSSVPRAITFFAQVLDLEVLRDDSAGGARQVTLGACGRAAVVLHAEAPTAEAAPSRTLRHHAAPRRGSQPVTLLVPDLEHAVAAAWDAGATLSCDVQRTARATGKRRSAIVLDPDGNQIELVEA